MLSNSDRVLAVCWVECWVCMMPSVFIREKSLTLNWDFEILLAAFRGDFLRWEGISCVSNLTTRFFTVYELVKVGMMNYRESFDYYNNMTGCAVGLLPFMKVPFMRRYIMYPFVLFGLDMFGDWKERHGKD